MVIKTDNHQTI